MNAIKKNPDSPVCYIKGVGEKRAKLLGKLGITTALQLAEHYPRGYIDFNETTAIAELMNDGSPKHIYIHRIDINKLLGPDNVYFDHHIFNIHYSGRVYY